MLRRFVIKITKILLSITMASMFIIVVLQVICRYVLEIPLYWSEELARYLMIWSGFLGAALGLSQGVHTSVQWFLRFVSPKIQISVEFMARILVLGFAIITLIASLQLMQFLKFQVSPAMRISMIYPFLAFPFCWMFAIRRGT